MRALRPSLSLSSASQRVDPIRETSRIARFGHRERQDFLGLTEALARLSWLSKDLDRYQGEALRWFLP